jgi:hypothetical protein
MDIRKPAPVTFDENVRKILIVDNSFRQMYPDSILAKDGLLVVSNTLIDTIRPIILNSVATFINEERLFDTVEVYPYYPKPIYTYYENDTIYELPLTRDEIQDICYRTESDALISIDYIGLEYVYQPYTGLDNGALKSHMGIIARAYAYNGDTLGPPAGLVHPFSFTVHPNEEYKVAVREIDTLTKKNAIWMADNLVNHFIPKWERTERLFYTYDLGEEEKIKKLIDSEDWSGAIYIWKERYENQKANNKKKITYALNIAMAYEFSDDMENALKWTNTADGLLKNNDKSIFATNIKKYKEMLDKRIKEAPTLKHQLRIE